MVLAERPCSPSSSRTTLEPCRGARWDLMNSNTSAVLTSAGSFATSVKNTLRSYATASRVFGRARAATKGKYSSSTEWPKLTNANWVSVIERDKQRKAHMQGNPFQGDRASWPGDQPKWWITHISSSGATAT